MSELQDDLIQYLEEQEQTEKESYKIRNDSAANWALRKIKQAQQKQEEVNALAVDEIEKINRWSEEENAKNQKDIDYFQGLLAQYAMEKRQQDSEFKSLKLPNGRIRFQKKQPKYNYDDDAVVEYLKKNERTDLFQTTTTEKPLKNDIKKAFTINKDKLIDPDTGEVIDGVTVEHPDDEFKVEVDK
ncbi:host-nuclease inhibitor Gam family protein [Oceanobacillus oncorhynchi]|uniref:host-nuclease inhibitor Gam family protein n=1 Tax=Oceanobacillus oncorhynchi TaxID=545501 RepID=UPI001868070B|nr:host-nuclease inhibitor Gam family protein [Oceanobacillus oncorhynchi]